MSYAHGEVFALTASLVVLTGDLAPAVAIASHRFVAPVDCQLEEISVMPTTSLTTDEVCSIVVGTAAVVAAYGTKVITNAVAGTAVATEPTLTTDGDNGNNTVLTRIAKNTEIAIAGENDGAAAAGSVNVVIYLRALLHD